jgi:5-methylcytosine-specific restriction endonuclease McrA
LLNKSTGVQWHVDHIIPLQGKNVSGLHVPENLQVIQGSLNIKKGNRFDNE